MPETKVPGSAAGGDGWGRMEHSSSMDDSRARTVAATAVSRYRPPGWYKSSLEREWFMDDILRGLGAYLYKRVEGRDITIAKTQGA